ncbi:unnamed protein product [Caenorhabditis brenneri]
MMSMEIVLIAFELTILSTALMICGGKKKNKSSVSLQQPPVKPLTSTVASPVAGEEKKEEKKEEVKKEDDDKKEGSKKDGSKKEPKKDALVENPIITEVSDRDDKDKK